MQSEKKLKNIWINIINNTDINNRISVQRNVNNNQSENNLISNALLSLRNNI